MSPSISPEEEDLAVLQMCVDRRLPRNLEDKAKLRAAKANKANKIQRTRLDPQTQAAIGIAFEYRKCWQPGEELHIRFLGGHPSVQKKVVEIARQWMDSANIKLTFDNAPDAAIRIAFRRGGSWSWVGMEALQIAPDEPTMNLGWLQPESPEEEYQRVVLHEFGHAIGAIHEHQHPESRIAWNREKVLSYYAGYPNFWTAAKTQHNVLDRYQESLVNSSGFDPHSIMLYRIPKELTLNGFEIPWRNSKLSDLDKEWAGKVYDPANRVA
jgi:hypothetical protein